MAPSTSKKKAPTVAMAIRDVEHEIDVMETSSNDADNDVAIRNKKLCLKALQEKQARAKLSADKVKITRKMPDGTTRLRECAKTDLDAFKRQGYNLVQKAAATAKKTVEKVADKPADKDAKKKPAKKKDG